MQDRIIRVFGKGTYYVDNRGKLYELFRSNFKGLTNHLVIMTDRDKPVGLFEFDLDHYDEQKLIELCRVNAM